MGNLFSIKLPRKLNGEKIIPLKNDAGTIEYAYSKE